MQYKNRLAAIFMFMVYSLIVAHDHMHIHHHLTGSVLETTCTATPCCRHTCIEAESCPGTTCHDSGNDTRDGNCQIIQVRPESRCTVDNIFEQTITDTGIPHEAASLRLSQLCLLNLSAIRTWLCRTTLYKEPYLALSLPQRAPPAYM